jgi:hypothetical protein
MKFTIAAGILTQTLSALSETVSSSKLLLQQGHQDANLARILSRAINQPKRQQRPRQGRRPNRRNLVSTPFDSAKDCDPLSNDPDVGILSCDLGYVCTVNQASSLGGVCTSTSRELQDSLCDLCGKGYAIGSDNFDKVLTMTIDGFNGTTCEDLNTMAYSFYSTLVASDSDCPSFAEAAGASGCCAPLCYICRDLGGFQYSAGSKVLEVPGFPDGTTCYDIYDAVSYAEIDVDVCPDVTAIVEGNGCCYGPIEEGDCSLCGDGTVYPDLLFDGGFNATCYDIQLVLSAVENATACSLYSAAYAPTCCAPSTPGVPIPAPMGSPTIPPSAPQPSDSSTLWSTTTVLSVMGLAVATAAGASDLLLF